MCGRDLSAIRLAVELQRLHMVPKKDRTIRACGDYRRLNERTVNDVYPIPSRDSDFAAGLAGCTIFSKLDLVKGYHQVIPVRKEDIPKTAISHALRTLQSLTRMPFGLKMAAQTIPATNGQRHSTA